ncbi:hypothetical protein PG993_000668 [Apiospora rasikravindrae]|uniref:DRBM domain-containing protein n=1 Tax=Apiospora rasikravindrae TaxID=990691 RepID=A0ABR1U971_9PEZI
MASFDANVYSDILQWVNMQQQLEISGQPSSMTAAQHKAVRDLHQLIKPRPRVTEPELGKQDWIGLLNRYRQAKPETHGIQFTDEPVNDPPEPLRWQCFCLIAEHPQPFPGAARGVDPATGLVPSFAKKQTAKHYAARCAVEWLVQQGLMPQRLAAEVPGAAVLRGAGAGASPPATTITRPLPMSSSPSSPEAKRQKMMASGPAEPASSSVVKPEQGNVESAATATAPTEDDNNDAVGGSYTGTVHSRLSLMNTTAVAKVPQNHQPQPPLINLFTSSSADSSASNSSGGTPIVPPSEPRTSPPATNTQINANAAAKEDGDNTKKVTAQVAELCNALGIGAPRYEVTSDPENPAYFSGHPVFHSTLEAGHFPHGTGHVENVFGKSNAKEEIARRVLVELRKIKQQRDDIKKELMAGLGPTVG